MFFCALLLTTLLSLFCQSFMSDSLWPHGLQHTRLPYSSPSPGACSNSRPLSQWCHPTISSSVAPSSCLQSFPGLGPFPMSRLFVISCLYIKKASFFKWGLLPREVGGLNPKPESLTGIFCPSSWTLARVSPSKANAGPLETVHKWLSH